MTGSGARFLGTTTRRASLTTRRGKFGRFKSKLLEKVGMLRKKNIISKLYVSGFVREAAKKVIFLNGRSIEALPPPP